MYYNKYVHNGKFIEQTKRAKLKQNLIVKKNVCIFI